MHSDSIDRSTSEIAGLTTETAAERLRRFGFNEPVTVRRESGPVRFFQLFLEPLIAILCIVSIVSFFIGDWINATIVLVMSMLGVVLNFVQTTRSERAAESLRKVVSPTANVLRDGEWRELPVGEVVPDDVIRVTAGDLVPADARLVESKELHVQESALTGESLPVRKDAATGDRIMFGTSVISGTATAVATSTGASTEFGKIAARLVEPAPETDFERGTRNFGYLIMRVVFVLVILVFFVNALLHRDLLESLLFSIALAVGLTPEFLPMITAVTLGRGAVEMARRKVIVKHLAAMQNLGSMDILCSDKTGTLTSGELSLQQHLGPFGDDDENVFRLAYLNTSFESGVRNAVDQAIRRSANPIDDAILRHDKPNESGYSKVDEIPFDFERRRVSVVVADERGERLIITKGAPESVLGLCERYDLAGVESVFDAAARAKCDELFRTLSGRGLRLLAVAYGPAARRGTYDSADESNLVFAGFLTFADTPLESSKAAIAALAADGVRIKILTGDNELVARHVCELVGIDVGRIVLGVDVDRLDDTALGVVAERESLFARVSPTHKHRILLALKRRGHVVGFLGDGLNDAPSLRAADVGISVSTATDVAKDAAEIVLMEQSLGVLHSGIIEGRKSFGNVMKYLLMGTSSNFGNMFSMAGASLILPFLPMLPTQILLNNFLYDLAQLTIPTDNVDGSFIRKPQHWDIRTIRNFMLVIGPLSSVYDFLTFYVLLHFFGAGEKEFHTGWFVESLATQTAVVFIIRTAGNPFKSRPSLALTATVASVIALALALPLTPLAGILGFTPLPPGYYIFLAGATVTYLGLVELVKRLLMSPE